MQIDVKRSTHNPRLPPLFQQVIDDKEMIQGRLPTVSTRQKTGRNSRFVRWINVLILVLSIGLVCWITIASSSQVVVNVLMSSSTTTQQEALTVATLLLRNYNNKNNSSSSSSSNDDPTTTTTTNVAATLTTASNNHKKNNKDRTRFIPLEELVHTQPETTCPPGLVRLDGVVRRRKRQSPEEFAVANQTSSSSSSASIVSKRIPRSIHITVPSLCVTQSLAERLDKLWKQRYMDHDIWVHNAAARRRLLYDKDWYEFPNFAMAFQCSWQHSQQQSQQQSQPHNHHHYLQIAEEVAFWKALVIWEYGGIYTNLNHITPQPNFHPSTNFTADDQAYFQVAPLLLSSNNNTDDNDNNTTTTTVDERGMLRLSPHFFAAEPNHPLLYVWIMYCWKRLYNLPDVTRYPYDPIVTSSEALQGALQHFRQVPTQTASELDLISKPLKLDGGRQTNTIGHDNRTLTVVPVSSAVRIIMVVHNETQHSADLYNDEISQIYQRPVTVQSNESCMIRLYISEIHRKKANDQQKNKTSNNNNTI